MLSIGELKKILKREDMSDEEAEKIRDGLHGLVEIIFEKWRVEKIKKQK